MRLTGNRLACSLLLAAALAYGAAERASAQTLKPVAQNQLCVTEGAIEASSNNQLQVNVPKMRAYLTTLTPQAEEVRFTYLGSTQDEKTLASGAIRSQFGLKLHAGDACNLVYAMWRIEPDRKIVVSVKSNPGEHTSAECGNRGYTNIKPDHSAPVAVVQPGETHTLRAEMNADQLRVYADGVLAWKGSVGADAAALPGPVGIRSDNAALTFELRAPRPDGGQPAPAPACRSGEDE